MYIRRRAIAQPILDLFEEAADQTHPQNTSKNTSKNTSSHHAAWSDQFVQSDGQPEDFPIHSALPAKSTGSKPEKSGLANHPSKTEKGSKTNQALLPESSAIERSFSEAVRSFADAIDWNTVEDVYAVKFSRKGREALPARMAFGSLLVKSLEKSSDEKTWLAILRQPAYQYLLGISYCSDTLPFAPKTISTFCRRFTFADLIRIQKACKASFKQARLLEKEPPQTGSDQAKTPKAKTPKTESQNLRNENGFAAENETFASNDSRLALVQSIWNMAGISFISLPANPPLSEKTDDTLSRYTNFRKQNNLRKKTRKEIQNSPQFHSEPLFENSEFSDSDSISQN